jgi:hypothetical protein
MIYPKAWVGFDYHIDHLEIVGNRFKAINPDGQVIWVSKELLHCQEADLPHNLDYSSGARRFVATDTDKDGKDELFITGRLLQKDYGADSLYFYRSGIMSWSRAMNVRTTYPGEDIDSRYSVRNITLIHDSLDEAFLLTNAYVSYPIRHQSLLFNSKGEIVSGPYLHTGDFDHTISKVLDIDGDDNPEVIMGGTNNRSKSAVLAILKPWNLSGVSPPYNNDLFIQSGMNKGSQKYYVSFPESPVSFGEAIRNCVKIIQYDSAMKTWTIDVREGRELTDQAGMGSATIIYRLDSLLIPQNLMLSDGSWEIMNMTLTERGLQTVSSFDQLKEELLSEVIVYHGDSVVHHPAAGIYFYK